MLVLDESTIYSRGCHAEEEIFVVPAVPDKAFIVGVYPQDILFESKHNTPQTRGMRKDLEIISTSKASLLDRIVCKKTYGPRERRYQVLV